jgi:hypothetical protein
MSEQERLAEIGLLTQQHLEARRLRSRLGHQIEQAGESLRDLGSLLRDSELMDRDKVSAALAAIPDKAALKSLLDQHATGVLEINAVQRKLREADAL